MRAGDGTRVGGYVTSMILAAVYLHLNEPAKAQPRGRRRCRSFPGLRLARSLRNVTTVVGSHNLAWQADLRKAGFPSSFGGSLRFEVRAGHARSEPCRAGDVRDATETGAVRPTRRQTRIAGKPAGSRARRADTGRDANWAAAAALGFGQHTHVGRQHFDRAGRDSKPGTQRCAQAAEGEANVETWWMRQAMPCASSAPIPALLLLAGPTLARADRVRAPERTDRPRKRAATRWSPYGIDCSSSVDTGQSHRWLRTMQKGTKARPCTACMWDGACQRKQTSVTSLHGQDERLVDRALLVLVPSRSEHQIVTLAPGKPARPPASPPTAPAITAVKAPPRTTCVSRRTNA